MKISIQNVLTSKMHIFLRNSLTFIYLNLMYVLLQSMSIAVPVAWKVISQETIGATHSYIVMGM